jgi:type VI protein secretion system component VasF
MPILEDLYNELRAQDEKEAQYIATALEIYVTGSLNVLITVPMWIFIAGLSL